MEETADSPPSRWTPVVAYAALAAATQVVWLTYAPVTTVAAGRFGVSETAVGWLANLFPLLYVVLAVPAGLLLDRSLRVGLLLGAVLTAGGASLRLVDDSFGWALAGQTVAAAVQPLVLNAVTAVTGRYLRERDRALGIALSTASIFGGLVVAFLLGALLPDASDLRALVGIGAGFSTVAAVALALTLRTPGRATGAAPSPGLRALATAARDPFLVRLCLLAFFPFGSFVALTTYGQALLEPAGVDAETASVVLLLCVVAGVVGCAVVPVLAVRRRAELRAAAYAVTLSALACLVLAVTPGSAAGLVAFVVVGLALLPGLPIVMELLERHTSAQGGDEGSDGTAAGLVWLSGNLGGLVVALVVGLLVEHPGPAFVLCAVLPLLGLPVLASLGPRVAGLSRASGPGPTPGPTPGLTSGPSHPGR